MRTNVYVTLYLFLPFLLGIAYLLLLWRGLVGTQQRHTIAMLTYISFNLSWALLGAFLFYLNVWTPYKSLTLRLKSLAQGKSNIQQTQPRTGYWKKAHKYTAISEQSFLGIMSYIKATANTQFDSEIAHILKETPIGMQLQEVRRHLQNQSDTEAKRSWAMKGLTEVGDILRNKQHLEIQSLSKYFLSYFVQYIDAQQGVIYLLNETEPDDTHLVLTASYAIKKTDFDNKRIELDEGLVGQCFKTKMMIHLKDLKDDYSPIFSGLGAASPHTLLILPICTHDKILGVMELGAWTMYEQYHLDFFESVCENLGITIDTFNMNMKIVAQLAQFTGKQAS
jgi:GAF domain